ncbi:hypothetical protein EXE30_06780 [Acinetobacter halotolerans]|uniref:Uncharacterized protein n=1 Tax=Acinetobacter halotolerans TaxID=1752076 RepID=A0A4Q6XJA0_9GAMM|nr:hypothetical protein [Acinetobacter halotolerans]RZF53674.1 hypothetical protein EXE30_06780 [Acinetobacter halotolerans]
MDIEWINKQREELDRLLGSKFDKNTIKFGVQLLSDQKVGAAMDIGFASFDRTPEDKKFLLEKIKVLEEENKELKRKLVMKTLAYR